MKERCDYMCKLLGRGINANGESKEIVMVPQSFVLDTPRSSASRLP